MSTVAEIFFDEDGWYYTDDDGDVHGPFNTEEEARWAWGRYRAIAGNCPTCRGE